MPRLREAYSCVDEWKSMWGPDLEAIAFNGATCDPTRVDPKVLQRVQQNCSHKPHFIKVVNNNAANGRPGLKQRGNKCQLTVPRPFVKEHFRELERVVTLETSEGKAWRVSFGAARTDPSWLQGWRRVAADNDLKPGEVIVFVLVANSRFHFTRFDEDGNIISETNPALGSRDNHSAETELCGTPQPSGLGLETPGQIAEAPFKRRRLRKVGQVMSKATGSKDGLHLAIDNKQVPLSDSGEAGSSSMADGGVCSHM